MEWPWIVTGQKYRELQQLVDEISLALKSTESALSAARHDAKKTAEGLKTAEQRHKTEMESARQSHRSESAQRDWCPPQWAEFAPQVSKQWPLLAEATVSALRGALIPGAAGMTSLVDRATFRSPSLWALYWVVAHGAEAVRGRLPDGINENGLTVAFADAVDDAAEDYKRLFSDAIDLEIGTGKLFEYVDENLQEVDTGADLVLVVSGQQLTPGGGARLLWFQAKKRARGETPWLLSYKQENSKHGTQCAALKRRHVPSRGSFCSYVNYAEGIPLVAAVPAEALNVDGTSADTRQVGVRLQEHVLSRVVALEAGQFTTAEDVFDFLADAGSSSGLPIEVVALDSPGSGLGQQLAAKIKALNQQRRKKRNRGQSYGI